MSFHAADDSKVRSISQRKGNATRAAIYISDYGKNQPSQFKIHNRKARVKISFREIDL
jgi:hypothetical protein